MSNHNERFLLSILCACCAFPFCVDAETFSAKVVSVVKPDIIKVSQDGKERILVLYGVESPYDISARAKEYVSSRIRGETLNFELVMEKPGLTYVDVLLPDGTSLNETLLSLGLATVEKLSAGDDEVYRQLEDDAKARKVGVWGDSDNAEPVSVEPNEESILDARESSEEFLARKEFETLAQFEGEFVKWALFSDDERKRIRASIEGRNARASGSARALEKSRSNNVSSLRNQQSNIGSSIARERAEQAANVADAYDDFDLGWNTRMLNAFVEDRNVDAFQGNNYSASINQRLANKYSLKASADLARVNREASAISAAHERNIQSGQRSLSEVNKALREQNSRLRLNAAMVARQSQRAASSIGRLNSLDAALAEEYVPVLKVRTAGSWNGDASETTPPFEVSTPLMRMDWYVARGSRQSKINIGLYDAKDDKLRAAAIFKKPPHQSFLFVDGPGEYYIKINVEGQVRYLVEAFAVDTN